ncbi:hypothetical protein Ae263Ps1_1903 [Pseudonocardia sp. Ae263_Ps1]|nr:hypothetical protein Ae150APs1_3420c [Pseudonocardia sp. Ae150A_Ps1]OLL84848.1 hypothetical protein Ae263Ps1_1903 [Pseudonocardia sp. Ae263_Ps1]
MGAVHGTRTDSAGGGLVPEIIGPDAPEPGPADVRGAGHHGQGEQLLHRRASHESFGGEKVWA